MPATPGAIAPGHARTDQPNLKPAILNPEYMETIMNSLLRHALVATLVLASPPVQAAAPVCEVPVTNPGDATFGLAITTTDPVARALFDAGIAAYWAGDAAAALHAFRAAQAAAPDCAMCHWGEALALGPRPQMPMPQANIRRAWEAIIRAQALEANAGPLERTLIGALRHRYGSNAMILREGLDHAWATAIEQVAAGAGEIDLVRLLVGEAQAILRAPDAQVGWRTR